VVGTQVGDQVPQIGADPRDKGVAVGAGQGPQIGLVVDVRGGAGARPVAGTSITEAGTAYLRTRRHREMRKASPEESSARGSSFAV